LGRDVQRLTAPEISYSNFLLSLCRLCVYPVTWRLLVSERGWDIW
jgi:hypothetical protein